MKTYEQFLSDVETICEGRIPFRSTKNPNSSGWMPSEKMYAKRKQLESALRRNKSNEALRSRYDRFMNVYKNPPVRVDEPSHTSSMEKYFKVNIGRSRRNIAGGRLLPKPKALSGNVNRRKIYLDMLNSEKK